MQITQAPCRPVEDVGIEPLPPGPGRRPEEIVRGVHRRGGQHPPGHPVAREHLTPEAAESWTDDTGITVISEDYATVTTETGRSR